MRDQNDFPDTTPAEQQSEPRSRQARRPDSDTRGRKVALEWIYAALAIVGITFLLAIAGRWVR